MALWTLLFVCGLVQGATLTANGAVDSVGVHRRSVSKPYKPFFDWNNIADNIIKLAKQDIVEKGKTKLSLPDVDEFDTVRVTLFHVPYRLRASQGTVGDLTAFGRRGDVLITKESAETLQAAVPLAVDRLLVRYGTYELSVVGVFNINGDVEVQMEGIAFRMTLNGREEGLGCTASLTSVEVTNMGKISIKVTGLYGFNGIAASILELYFQGGRSGIVASIERVLLQELHAVLLNFNCDEFHSLFLLSGS